MLVRAKRTLQYGIIRPQDSSFLLTDPAHFDRRVMEEVAPSELTEDDRTAIAAEEAARAATAAAAEAQAKAKEALAAGKAAASSRAAKTAEATEAARQAEVDAAGRSAAAGAETFAPARRRSTAAQNGQN